MPGGYFQRTGTRYAWNGAGKEIFSAGGRKYGNKSNRAYPGTFAGNAKQKGKSCGHLWKQPEVKEKASAEI